jgi:hypothetical protein
MWWLNVWLDIFFQCRRWRGLAHAHTQRRNDPTTSSSQKAANELLYHSQRRRILLNIYKLLGDAGSAVPVAFNIDVPAWWHLCFALASASLGTHKHYEAQAAKLALENKSKSA